MREKLALVAKQPIHRRSEIVDVGEDSQEEE